MAGANLIERLGGRRMIARIAEELCVEMLLDDRLTEPCRNLPLAAMVRANRCMLMGLLSDNGTQALAPVHAAFDAAGRVRSARSLVTVADLLRNALQETGVDAELAEAVVARVTCQGEANVRRTDDEQAEPDRPHR